MSKSSMHLVPLLKGAVDPGKGIVFRTYYVRPEKLQSMVKEAKEVPTKSYIGHVQNYEAIDKAIKTGDITGLRTAFPKSSESWNKVVARHANFDSMANNAQYIQKLNQNIYGYVLSEDKLALSTIKSNFKKAAKIKKFDIQNIEKPNKGGLNRKGRKSKQVKVVESAKLSFPIIPKNILFTLNNALNYSAEMQPLTNNKILNQPDLNEHTPDYGSNVKFKVKLSNGYAPVAFGHGISKFINFINAHPTKIAEITKQFMTVSSMTDITGTINNIIYKASTYFNDPGFWVPLLSKCCFDYYSRVYDTPDDFDSSINFYRQLILMRLDKDEFKNIYNTYHDVKIEEVLKHKKSLDKLLLSPVFTNTDKAYILASLDNSTSTKYLSGIISHISMIAQDNKDDAMELLSAVATTLTNKNTIELINTVFPNIFSIENMIKELHLSEINNTPRSFVTFLLQLLGAKLNKTHYIPYSSVQYIKHGVFAPMLVSRLFNYFVKNKEQDIIRYIAEQKNKNKNLPDKITVGLTMVNAEIPKDKQVFVSMTPFKNFTVITDNTDKSQYILIGEAIKNSVISVIEGNVLILDGVSAISFPEYVPEIESDDNKS